MASTTPQYFLFPHTVLPEREWRLLSLLLPQLSVLQVISPPAVPLWLREQVAGWPVLKEPEDLENVKLCLRGYREFAAVHGENTMLSSLSHDQISEDFADSRFRLQAELKRKGSRGPDHRKLPLLEAAVFLEMARDLEEKESEVEHGLSEIDRLEGAFREVLGISDEEELTEALATLNPPLRAEHASRFHMLPERIASWLQLLSHRLPLTCPVLVTTTERVVEELLDPLQIERERAEKPFEPTRVTLSSLPAMDDLPLEDLLSLFSNPEATPLLTACWQGLEEALGAVHDSAAREPLFQATEVLTDYLYGYRQELGLPPGATVLTDLIFDETLRWGALGNYCDRTGALGESLEKACPNEAVRIVVCHSKKA